MHPPPKNEGGGLREIAAPDAALRRGLTRRMAHNRHYVKFHFLHSYINVNVFNDLVFRR